MIKEKFLKFLCWFKDHFSILLEVVIRLVVGFEAENKEPNELDGDESSIGKDSYHEKD